MRLPRWVREGADKSPVPAGVHLAAAWSWRFIVIIAALAVTLLLIFQLSFIVVPLLIAVLLASLATPMAVWLRRHWIPKWLATLISLLVLVSVVSGLIWLVIEQIRQDWSSLETRSLIAYDDFIAWLLVSPLHITETQLNDWLEQMATALNLDSAWLLTGALSISSSLGTVLVGAGLALFALVFFIHDGERIFRWIVSLLPREAQIPVAGAGQRGWGTLTSFVKVQIFVAVVDAVGIGLGAFFLGLPLVIPIAVAVFLGAFVPIIGAFVAGGVAAFIALVYEGPVAALIMIIIVLVVQQVEGQILQPLVMGPALKVHPLAVVLAVTSGGFLAGIPGVLFAVPVVAYLNVFIRYLVQREWVSDPAITPWLQPKVGL